jgi:hypothetical protein
MPALTTPAMRCRKWATPSCQAGALSSVLALQGPRHRHLWRRAIHAVDAVAVQQAVRAAAPSLPGQRQAGRPLSHSAGDGYPRSQTRETWQRSPRIGIAWIMRLACRHRPLIAGSLRGLEVWLSVMSQAVARVTAAKQPVDKLETKGSKLEVGRSRTHGRVELWCQGRRPVLHPAASTCGACYLPQGRAP